MPVSDAIPVVGRAYAELSSRTAVVPNRLSLTGRDEKGVTLIMPGYLSVDDSMAVKMVSVFPENTGKNLPAIHGLIIVIDSQTGMPLAAIEGAYLTSLRTGASCGLATDLLSRRDSANVAMIGAGAQSRLIVPAVCSVREIEKIFVFDISAESAVSWVDEMSEMFRGKIDFRAVNDPAEAIRKADIICTATTSETPVFSGLDLRLGSHVNGIGSFTPDMNEVGLETIRRCSKIVVDSIDGALSEAGDLIQAIEYGAIGAETIHAEIGEILNGSKPGRENDTEITFFKSVGNAALDVAVGAEIFRRALAEGSGVSIDL